MNYHDYNGSELTIVFKTGNTTITNTGNILIKTPTTFGINSSITLKKLNR